MSSGVYIIVNDLTGKFYIGSSHRIEKRIVTHKRYLKTNKHHSVFLQKSWNKYGHENFYFAILEECEKENLLQLEQFYLDKLRPEYNSAKNSLAPMTGKKHNLKTIKKMRSWARPRGKDHYAFGKPRDREHVLSALRARIGLKHNSKTRLKMSKTAKKLNSISRINFDILRKTIIDSNGVLFKSCTEAATYHKIHVSTLCDILKGRHSKTRKGVSFKYV